MSSTEERKQSEDKTGPVPWGKFLEEYPPGKFIPVKDVIEIDGPFMNIATPDIQLHCNTQSCNGKQVFKYSGLKIHVNIGKSDDYFLKYSCRNCKVSYKNFTVHVKINSLFGINNAFKYD